MTQKIRDQIAPREPTHIEVVIGHTGPFASLMEDMGTDDYQSAVDAIKRHIDNVAQAFVVTSAVCRHCGTSPGFGDKGPYCCTSAIEEWNDLTSARATP